MCTVRFVRGCPYGVANVKKFNGYISEFKLQSSYCVHFWTNTLGKGMNSFIPSGVS